MVSFTNIAMLSPYSHSENFLTALGIYSCACCIVLMSDFLQKEAIGEVDIHLLLLTFSFESTLSVINRILKGLVDATWCLCVYVRADGGCGQSYVYWMCEFYVILWLESDST